MPKYIILAGVKSSYGPVDLRQLASAALASTPGCEVLHVMVMAEDQPLEEIVRVYPVEEEEKDNGREEREADRAHDEQEEDAAEASGGD